MLPRKKDDEKDKKDELRKKVLEAKPENLLTDIVDGRVRERLLEFGIVPEGMDTTTTGVDSKVESFVAAVSKPVAKARAKPRQTKTRNPRG